MAFLGPLTLRHVGYVLTGLLSLLVAVAVLRDPRPRTLILGLAAATLVAFCFLTTMHERYAYGALVFLMLLIPEARVRWLGDRVRRRVHAEPARGRPADAADRRAAAGRRARSGIVGSVAMLAIAATTVSAPAPRRVRTARREPA